MSLFSGREICPDVTKLLKTLLGSSALVNQSYNMVILCAQLFLAVIFANYCFAVE